MLDLVLNYGVFLLKVATVAIAMIVVVSVLLKAQKSAATPQGQLKVEDLAAKYKKTAAALKAARLPAKLKKNFLKQQQKADKERQKNSGSSSKGCIYVINFKGDMAASAVAGLREEISAVLAVADKDKDEVLLRLESPGGVVHGYGLAASQLKRIRDHGLKLTVAVDKVAASGGYMMACVADKIVAAPFAVVGSIGVVAQVPNVHKLLRKHDVDFDVMTAGQYKRTVTVFGENTEQGKQKFQQELEQTHELFKQFVSENRHQVDIDKVATGEHWFGRQALELKLVDELATSDDLIINYLESKDVLGVSYSIKTKLVDKIFKRAESSVRHIFEELANRKTFY